ncbi:phage tail assembly chaperone [Pseudomonas cichorii]|nr:phage tail assembly chaperone [Pseudomonas cichorii]MBX8534532.1 phage tail assembly chaperone [Pseudomonas cichorii]
MAKIKIAQNPTFSADVQIPRVGGEPLKVKFTFKYLDRVALAAMFDKWNLARQEHAAVAKEDGATFEAVTAGEIDLQVAQIQDIVTGWGFDDEFNQDSIKALVSTSVGAPQAVVDAYQAAYAPARLGN